MVVVICSCGTVKKFSRKIVCNTSSATGSMFGNARGRVQRGTLILEVILALHRVHEKANEKSNLYELKKIINKTRDENYEWINKTATEGPVQRVDGNIDFGELKLPYKKRNTRIWPRTGTALSFYGSVAGILYWNKNPSL